MSLRVQAAADFQAIVENEAEFGRAITVTDPNGAEACVTGLTTDIGEAIDAETGIAVSGRRASVVLPIARLTALGLGVPRAVADRSSKPWLVTFDDIEGNRCTFKVADAAPDSAIGAVRCLLEAYDPV